MILRSFQRKGLCDSGLKAKSTTFVRNITTIRLRSQFVILKMNINMTDITEKTENGELVTNRDQWKSHATLTLLATQDCPLWLQYD